MGLHQDYPFHDTLSWLKFMIKPTGVTFERLEEEQIVYATPPVKYRKHVDTGFNTPSGKVDFYCQLFKAHGYRPFPVYAEPAGEALGPHNTTDKGFSLIGSSRRSGQFIHTRFKYVETLSRMYPEPLVRIHPQDAAQRGIRDGDEVEVASAQGKIRIKAKVEDHGTARTCHGGLWMGEPHRRESQHQQPCQAMPISTPCPVRRPTGSFHARWQNQRKPFKLGGDISSTGTVSRRDWRSWCPWTGRRAQKFRTTSIPWC